MGIPPVGIPPLHMEKGWEEHPARFAMSSTASTKDVHRSSFRCPHKWPRFLKPLTWGDHLWPPVLQNGHQCHKKVILRCSAHTYKSEQGHGLHFNSMILEVFANLNDSVFSSLRSSEDRSCCVGHPIVVVWDSCGYSLWSAVLWWDWQFCVRKKSVRGF